MMEKYYIKNVKYYCKAFIVGGINHDYRIKSKKLFFF